MYTYPRWFNRDGGIYIYGGRAYEVGDLTNP